ncbi:MAG TPA: hypothetical protein VK789_18300 [Bryobacteraceae bacterium]|nr:hypothetical protein [Bryobacteraceae bacterium]
MADNIVVIPGSARLDLSAIDAIAGEFGWKIRIAEDAGEVAAVASRRKVRAVLLCRDAFGSSVCWQEAIRLANFAFAGAPVIALHGFAESIAWADLSDAGAFHSLWLPLKENEVRQSLGFLAHSSRREASLSEWNGGTIERVMAASGLPT